MIRRLAAVVAGCLIAAGCGASDPPAASTTAAHATSADAVRVPPAARRGPSVLRGTLRDIDGRRRDLGDFRGQVVMVVNTASRCGFTPQFEALEALYRDRRDQGVTVLGFPSDDFRQEVASDREAATFCRVRYGVTFPMFSRSRVTGPDANVLFQAIGREAPAPQWNFTKYLLDRRGRVAAHLPSATAPDAAEVQAAIDQLLAEG